MSQWPAIHPLKVQLDPRRLETCGWIQTQCAMLVHNMVEMRRSKIKLPWTVKNLTRSEMFRELGRVQWLGFILLRGILSDLDVHRMECQRIQPWYATMAWCPLTFINLALSKVTATNGRDALQIVAYSVDWNLTSPMGHAFLNVIFFAFWYPPALKHQERSMARKRMHKRVSKMPCYFFSYVFLLPFYWYVSMCIHCKNLYARFENPAALDARRSVPVLWMVAFHFVKALSFWNFLS